MTAHRLRTDNLFCLLRIKMCNRQQLDSLSRSKQNSLQKVNKRKVIQLLKAQKGLTEKKLSRFSNSLKK